MIIYGRNPVREALRGSRTVTQVWATRNAAQLDWVEQAEIRSGDELARICDSNEHQGVCAETSEYSYVDAAQLLARPNPLIVALDQITDPNNFGAICRTAECAGADGVVIGERRSAEVTPAVCKASAGAVEHLAIAQVGNLARFLANAKEASCWCYGAAGEVSTSFEQPDYRGGVVLVLGAEGQGLRPGVVAKCDELISLPLRGKIDSLNVNAATAAILYQMVLQRS